MGNDFDEYGDEDSFRGSREPRGRYQQQRGNRPQWRIIEVAVRENAAVEVSMLDLQVPRFSFKVGTAHFPRQEGDPITVSPRLTVFNAREAVDLLGEMEEKYTDIRERKIEELEARKRDALKRNATANPEVTVRRSTRRDM